MVTLDDIRAARERVRPIARITPLEDVSSVAGRPLFLKCESMQPGGAFRSWRVQHGGAAHERAASPGCRSGFSSGNHGQAMALAARELGAPAVVVMPTTAPKIKVDGARGFGAEVIFAGTTSVDRRVRAEEEAARRGLTMVPPFDHEWIIAGQATAGLEILEQLPGVEAVLVPIGGGGPRGGRRHGDQAVAPGREGHRSEADGAAAAMKASIEAGHAVTLPKTESIADGLMPVRPGDLTFLHVQKYADGVVTVDDGQIIDAVLWLVRTQRSSRSRQARPAWPPPSPASPASTDRWSRSSAAATSASTARRTARVARPVNAWRKSNCSRWSGMHQPGRTSSTTT